MLDTIEGSSTSSSHLILFPDYYYPASTRNLSVFETQYYMMYIYGGGQTEWHIRSCLGPLVFLFAPVHICSSDQLLLISFFVPDRFREEVL